MSDLQDQGSLSSSKGDGGKKHSTLFKGYAIGLVLCILITLASFAMVGYKVLSGTDLIFVIAILAFIQFLVQLKFFLHLSLKPEARWNLISLIFTLIIAVIVVAGSIWIMFSLNTMMM